MPLPQSFIEELHDRNDIVEVISQSVALRRRGRLYTGLCPFHNEKTPSFTVYPDTRSYFCFGCGAGGDVISFVMARENLDYIEAVRWLANRAGLQLPEETDDSGYTRRRRCFEMNKLAARFFFDTLNAEAGKPARLYLRKERRLDDATIRRFGIGYASDAWNALRDHLRAKGYKDDEMVEAGLCSRSEKTGSVYDFFRERVMFPIFDLRGNVLAFSGRTIVGDSRKYVNTKDTPVFKKSRAIFAMNIAKNTDTRRIILCEGQMDVIAIHAAGFDNAVAACGTALTDEQVHIIAQYADEVVLAYDGDGAGQKAAKRAIELFKNTNLAVKVLAIEGAKDPDEYIKAFGPDKFRELVEGSSNSTEYQLTKAKRSFDTDTDNGRVQYLSAAADILSRAPSPTERDLYAGRVAADMGVSKDALVRQIEGLRRRLGAKKEKEREEALVRAVPEQYHLRGGDAAQLAPASAQRKLIALVFANPDLAASVTRQVSREDFVSADEGAVFAALAGQIARDEFTGIPSMSAVLPAPQMSLLSGILAENVGVNFSPGDADFLIGRIVRSRETPNAAAVKEMDAGELQKLIEKNKKNTAD